MEVHKNVPFWWPKSIIFHNRKKDVSGIVFKRKSRTIEFSQRTHLPTVYCYLSPCLEVGHSKAANWIPC